MRFLRCPRCQEPLHESPADLLCEACSRRWPIKDGVPHFGGKDRGPHGLTPAQREEILRTAAGEGWDVALHDFLRSINPGIYRQAIDEYRAQWRFVLPLSVSDYVLDLNCGWGAITFNLAETCAGVVAADACSEQARFVGLRARQKGQNNIVALQLGLSEPLPFAAGSFDFVVLFDALAWLPDGEVRRLLLRRISTVLKPGGAVLLAESNRLSAVRLVKWLPAGKPCTVRGYKELLHSVGFQNFRVYALVPSHLEPFFIIPLERWTPLEYFLTEILAGRDFGAYFSQRSQHVLYRLARIAASWVPSYLLARCARPFIPSIAIVAQV